MNTAALCVWLVLSSMRRHAASAASGHGVETKQEAAVASPLGTARDAYSEPVANGAERAAGPVVEPFAAPAGRVLGYIAAAAGLLLALGSAFTDFGTNRGLFLFGVATACIAWVVMIRPAVAAHEHGVLLRNMARDVFVPWSSIERTRSMQTLQVVTPEATYHGLGVSRSARSMMKEARRGSGATPVFGAGGAFFGRGYTPRDSHLVAAQQRGSGSYQSYVESRLQDLATQRSKATAQQKPLVAWAVLPIIALLATVACVVLILV